MAAQRARRAAPACPVAPPAAAVSPRQTQPAASRASAGRLRAPAPVQAGAAHGCVRRTSGPLSARVSPDTALLLRVRADGRHAAAQVGGGRRVCGRRDGGRVCSVVPVPDLHGHRPQRRRPHARHAVAAAPLGDLRRLGWLQGARPCRRPLPAGSSSASLLGICWLLKGRRKPCAGARCPCRSRRSRFRCRCRQSRSVPLQARAACAARGAARPRARAGHCVVRCCVRTDTYAVKFLMAVGHRCFLATTLTGMAALHFVLRPSSCLLGRSARLLRLQYCLLTGSGVHVCLHIVADRDGVLLLAGPSSTMGKPAIWCQHDLGDPRAPSHRVPKLRCHFVLVSHQAGCQGAARAARARPPPGRWRRACRRQQEYLLGRPSADPGRQGRLWQPRGQRSRPAS